METSPYKSKFTVLKFSSSKKQITSPDKNKGSNYSPISKFGSSSKKFNVSLQKVSMN
jgi:hypothetical protein